MTRLQWKHSKRLRQQQGQGQRVHCQSLRHMQR
jgi:hypothetical protein